MELKVDKTILRKKILYLALVFIYFLPGKINAQDTIKFETIKTIRDIPHSTGKQKWLWPHRVIIFFFMKERPVSNDTAYYSAYRGKLVVTVPLTTRFTNFQLGDASSSNLLRFEPNSHYDVGISINSRFASFLVNTGITLFNNDEKTKGKTNYNDYQFNFYSKRSTTDLTLQTYKGFFIQNAGSYYNFGNSATKPYEIRPDVSATSFSYNYYYIFNHNRFSYRSSFAFTEIQKKSAGSVLFGGYASVFAASGDSSLVSQTFKPYFDSASYIQTGAVVNFGLNIGYVYTVVIKKKFLATLSLVQGLGTDKTVTVREDGSRHGDDFRFASKQNLRFALRYDTGKFFAGTMATIDSYSFDNKDRSTFNYAYGKVRVFLGYRFAIAKQERRLLQKLNLIDYR